MHLQCTTDTHMNDCHAPYVSKIVVLTDMQCALKHCSAVRHQSYQRR
jgi:hypothetical protein